MTAAEVENTSTNLLLVLKNFRKIQRLCKDSGIIGHFGFILLLW
jgi:hypothetical protein